MTKRAGFGGAEDRMASRRWGTWQDVPFLSLKDGERAMLRFMASGEDDDGHLDVAYFHWIPVKTRGGQSTQYPEWCPRTEDDDAECEECERGDKPPTSRFGLWCWVYYIYRREPDAEGRRKRVKTRDTNEIVWKEPVESPQFWNQGLGQQGRLWDDLKAVFQAHGSLMAVDCWVQRHGAGQETYYTIKEVPNSQGEPEELFLDIKKSLPDSDDVMAGRASWSMEAYQAGETGAEEEIPIDETTPMDGEEDEEPPFDDDEGPPTDEEPPTEEEPAPKAKAQTSAKAPKASTTKSNPGGKQGQAGRARRGPGRRLGSPNPTRQQGFVIGSDDPNLVEEDL